MSSDTAKDNASVVDSSVTEKHDMGNSDDPESSSYKANKDGYPTVAEEAKAWHSNGRLENSTENKNGKLYNTRYFIIKSLNHQNIQLSIEKGIWATQVMNEPILEEAFHNSGKVILIFSVNMSGYFQGYAQMMSSVGWRRDNVWSRGNGKNSPWGRSFKVKWLHLNDLPFQKTLHLKNPLNDYKPVKISRDCQELPQDIGEALCKLLDGMDDVDVMQTSFTRDDLPPNRPCIEPSCSMGDEEYHMPPLQMSLGRTPTHYPSFLYHHQGGASNFHLAQRCGRDAENLPLTSLSSKISRMNHSRKGNLSNLQVDSDMSARYDFWGLSADSPLASTITEDDFLEMSYEEYLEAHSRSFKQLCHPAVGGPSWTVPLSSSKPQDDDSNSSFVMDKPRLRKRTRQDDDSNSSL